jgi:hypothetical protein
MKLYVKIALGVVFFFIIVAIVVAFYMFNLKHADMVKAKPDFIITATALQKAFEDNETEASVKYVKKIIEVTGEIVTISPADTSNTNIALKTGNTVSSVICTCHSTQDISKFKAGEEVTIRGECSGFLMDVLLNNCAIILTKK